MESIEERVITIMAEWGEMDQSKINKSSDLREELGLDSMDFVGILLTIEEEFGIEISEEEVENITNVGDLVTFLKRSI